MGVLSIVTSFGDEIVFTGNPDFFMSDGWAGWGKAQRANYKTEGASDGFTHRGHRLTGRKVSVPAVLLGSSSTIRNNLRLLARAVDKPFTFRFVQDDGVVFTIGAVYESGLDGLTGSAWWVRETLKFDCPDPLWTSEVPQQYGWWFDAGEAFLERRVLSTDSLNGEKQVLNNGDFETRPTWVFQGPFTRVGASVDGVGFVYDGVVSVGQVLKVSPTGAGWLVELDGVNVFENTVWGSRFPVLPRGESTVSLSLTGAGDGTRVSLFWAERREVVF